MPRPSPLLAPSPFLAPGPTDLITTQEIYPVAYSNPGAWANPQNALTNDGTVASKTITGGVGELDLTQYALLAEDGGPIPAGAPIINLVLRVRISVQRGFDLAGGAAVVAAVLGKGFSGARSLYTAHEAQVSAASNGSSGLQVVTADMGGTEASPQTFFSRADLAKSSFYVWTQLSTPSGSSTTTGQIDYASVVVTWQQPPDPPPAGTTIPLQGAASITLGASTPPLRVRRGLAGAAALDVGGSGLLRVTRPLAARASVTLDADGKLGVRRGLAGQVGVDVGASQPQLAVHRSLEGHASIAVNASGALTVQGQAIPLRGSAHIAVNAAGELGVRRGLAGQRASIEVGAGTPLLHVRRGLRGTAAASLNAAALMRVRRRLAGSARANVTADGGLRMHWRLAGQVSVTVDATGRLATGRRPTRLISFDLPLSTVQASASPRARCSTFDDPLTTVEATAS